MQFDRTYLRALVIAGLLGLPVAVAAVAFTSAIHGLESLVWHEIPDVLDWSEPPWWFVMLVPTLAAIPVALSFKLPGGGGHGPPEQRRQELREADNVGRYTSTR